MAGAQCPRHFLLRSAYPTSLETGFDAKLHGTRRTQCKDSRTEPNEIRRTACLRRSIDGARSAIERLAEQRERAVEVVMIKNVKRRDLRFDAELFMSFP